MEMLKWVDQSVLLFAIFIGFLLVITTIFGGRRRKKISGKFVPISHLNTRAEHNFFTQLNNQLPDDIYLVAKVRLADLCKPDNPKNIVGFNKIARKHIDFVLIEQSSSKVVAAIELDDKSHQKRENIRRDKDKNYALASAGIKLFRVKAAKNYSNAINDILSYIRLNPLKSNENQGLFSGLLKKVRE